MVTIVNYGLGNVQAFVNIYRQLHLPVRVAQCADDLAEAERIILPGVGAFDWAMARLTASGMRAQLDELVVERKRPVLGVCVGMQMMARSSEEGTAPGLGWIDADVLRLDEGRGTRPRRLPHMGWNDVIPARGSTLFRSLNEPQFYFLHSYHVHCGQDAYVAGTTDYDGEFVSAVEWTNIFGVQFHPEKSHDWGIQLLRNFATA